MVADMRIEEAELLLTVDEMSAGINVDADHRRSFAFEAIEVVIEQRTCHAYEVFLANTAFNAGDGRLTG